ncbi:acyltransferase [Rhodopseudomonas sp. P2A-2r]|uniref:acyltransferase n=1 Tax=unclassified Rhodopseudomonas TaxID=2638247 RepID=UPI002234C858|nr:acyltransferase [Rhodopseudomonas sp. P2A-2r]UZE52126.1 acyltransferase [Rhodopseudomonas sp. P2A-2r]
MRGTIRKVSMPRRLIMDLMHASTRVPFVALRRRLALDALAAARAGSAHPPGWTAIFTKAFCLVAKDEPVLRTMFIGGPWPHFYELPRSVGMIAIARNEGGEPCVLPQRVCGGEAMTLAEIDALIRHAMTAPIEKVPMFRKLMRVTRLPLPLRRLLWAGCFAIGRQRANFCGNFGITSVAAFGPGNLDAISPGPFLLSYGALEPDGTMEVVIRWDHRVTDAAIIAQALSRLEQVLNTEIADEVLADYPPATKSVRAVAF